jgi:FkbM family methyltransferase
MAQGVAATMRVPGVARPLRVRLHPAPDPLSESIHAHGVWEPFESSVFLSLLQPGDTVVDAGANIGYYTLLAAQAVGAKGHVHAIEPDPDNLRLLNENLALNGLSNVTVHPLALSHQEGNGALYHDPRNRGDHRLYPSSGESRESLPVRVTALDTLLGELPPPRLVKIDAQGSELAIFRGMAALLNRRPPRLRIITEIWPYGLRQAGGSPAELLALLREQGFRLTLIDEAARRLEPVGHAELEQRLETAWYTEARGFINVLLS